MGKIRRISWIAGGAVLLLGVGGVGYWLGRAQDDAGGGEDAPVVAEEAGGDEVHPHVHKLKNPDGSWKYTNRLVHETSPYLLLHAHNPVDWYPWGPEALERAKAEDRPIFLSVGYSTCYWCHVMERLVFSDPEIAALMNRWFVNIKVDREERPDLDEIYMTATQLVAGSGGWPNSVFLTPDLKPFFAGTYFPPDDRYGRPGFPRVLQALHDLWVNGREKVEEKAEYLAANIRRIQEGGGAPEGAALERGLVDGAIRQIRGRYDAAFGGFGRAPKFPPSQDLELLMAEYERTGEAGLMEMVAHTLERMARGGMYDHLGGGFHRYSTDAQWLVPHFEKMLYNQAQLSKAYLHAYRLTGNEGFRRTAEDIFRFVENTLTSPEGAFYSALDSETDGIEGKYYLWTEREIRGLLGERAGLFLDVYALASMPEGEGRAIYMPRSLAESAKSLGMPVEALRARLEPLKAALLEARGKRARPLLDTKVLTAWNGLMIDACAYGYEVLGEAAYLEAARKAAAFVLDRLGDGQGNLYRSYRDGEVKHDGFQEDYAFLIRGLLGLHRASGEKAYLDRAETLADRMVARFWDKEGGGFFFTSGREDLMVRTKSPYDSAIPSGNSAAAQALLTLGRETGREDFLEKARRTLQAFAGPMGGNPGAFKSMALALYRYLDRAVGPGAGKGEMDASRVPRSEDLVRAEAFISADRLVPGGEFQVAVRLQVAGGWHINANPASLDFLLPTTLEVRSDLPVRVRRVEYPPGQELAPGFADRPLAVYTGEVVVRATLGLDGSAGPGSGALYLRARYQACDDRRCLAPAEVELRLEVQVGEKGVQPGRLHPEIFGSGQVPETTGG